MVLIVSPGSQVPKTLYREAYPKIQKQREELPPTRMGPQGGGFRRLQTSMIPETIDFWNGRFLQRKQTSGEIGAPYKVRYMYMYRYLRRSKQDSLHGYRYTDFMNSGGYERVLMPSGAYCRMPELSFWSRNYNGHSYCKKFTFFLKSENSKKSFEIWKFYVFFWNHVENIFKT